MQSTVACPGQQRSIWYASTWQSRTRITVCAIPSANKLQADTYTDNSWRYAPNYQFCTCEQESLCSQDESWK
eukprot:4971590-Pyramimonas_sp.AAC.2